MKKNSLLTSTPIRAVHRPVINTISKWGKSMLISNQLIMNARMLLALVVLISFHGTAIADESEIAFDIDAQELGAALNEFALQSDKEILFVEAETADKSATKVSGTYAPTVALDLLLADTGLEYRVNELDTVLVGAAAEQRGDSDSKNLTSAPALMVQTQPTEQAARSLQRSDSQSRNDESRLEDVPLEEIIVTGTNIRGAETVGSKPFVFDREALDQSGFSTPQDLFRVLPQNTGIGGNEITSAAFISNNDANLNTSLGSGINLRGLGTQSTLTLINGRRAASNNFGTLTDVSLIPLVAVERIDVLADGASAIYGADAVGGVVNFVLRSGFEGAETRLRYGTVSSGDQDEVLASQIFGTAWDSGDAIFTYEYFKRDALESADRSFAADADLTPFGGDDLRTRNSNPGTIRANGTTYAVPAGQDGTSLLPGDLVEGTANFGNQRRGTFLLPSQERHSVIVGVNQSVSRNASMFLEGRYATRDFETRSPAFETNLTVPDSNAFFVDPVGGLTSYRIRYSFIDDLGPQVGDGKIEAYSIVAGGNIELTETWRLDVFGTYNREDEEVRSSGLPNRAILADALADSNPTTAFNPFGDGSHTAASTIDLISGYFSADRSSELRSVNAKADGSLFALSGGDVRLAVGLEYREEELRADGIDFRNSLTPVNEPTEEFGRDVTAGFGEIFVPVVGSANQRRGLQRLELSLAVRAEDYSDFGRTTNPKYGVLWAPSESVNFRGTWGTSFRAPSLRSLDTSGNGIFITNIIPDPMATDGNTQTAVLFGNDENIGPEEATVWQVGFDISIPSSPNLEIGVTYFDIEYEDRIAGLFGSLISVFTNEDQFAPIVTRDVDDTTAQMILNSPELTSNFCGCTDVEAIVNVRDANVSVTEVNGIDATISYQLGTKLGDFDFDLNGSYYLKFEEALTSTAPLVEKVDTVGSPIDLRLRGSVTWSLDEYSIAAFVNHADGYTDNTSIVDRNIDSYTTVDMRLAYSAGEREGNRLLDNLEVALTVNNLFDEDPPFFNNVARAVAFDFEQSNPQGRFIALQVLKVW